MTRVGNMITELDPNEVIVVGTNIQGVHGAGAAAYAKEHFGLADGVGFGLCGDTFAVNTMEGVHRFMKSLKAFVVFAAANPDLTFYMTPVGCGIAGYSHKFVAAELRELIAMNYHDTVNIVLPPEWSEL